VVVFQILTALVLGLAFWLKLITIDSYYYLIPTLLVFGSILTWIVFPIIHLTSSSNTDFGLAKLAGFVALVTALIAAPTIFAFQGGNFYHMFWNRYGPNIFWAFAMLESMSCCLLLVHHFTFLGPDNKLPETTRSFVRVVITLITFDALLFPPLIILGFLTLFLAGGLNFATLSVLLSWLFAVPSLVHLIAGFCALYPLFRSGSKQNFVLYFVVSIITAICDLILSPAIAVIVLIDPGWFRIRIPPSTYAFDIILAIAKFCSFVLIARFILTIVSAVQARKIKNELDSVVPEELALLNPQNQVLVYVPIHGQNVQLPIYVASPVINEFETK